MLVTVLDNSTGLRADVSEAERTALQTTVGVWQWLLSPAGERLDAEQIRHVIGLTRSLYFAVLELEQPQTSLLRRIA